MDDTHLARQGHQGPSLELPKTTREGKHSRHNHRCKRSSVDDHGEQLPCKKSWVSSGEGKTQMDTILHQSCAIHSASSDKLATHKNMHCWVLRQVAKVGLELLENPDNRKTQGIEIDHYQGRYSSEGKDGHMIYDTHSPCNQPKRALREIYAIENTTTSDNKWLDVLFTSDRQDQPMGVLSRGVASLILDLIIDGYRMSKFLSRSAAFD